jgi:hypothetical protein
VPHLRNPVIATLGGVLLASAAAAPAASAEPNALTTLLPHEKGRALCYVSNMEPVTYPLEDIPARKKPRTVTIKRFLFELKSEKHDDDDTTTPPTPGEFYYYYRIVADVVGTKARLISAGECGAEDGSKVFGCGSDCDGGTMAFDVAAGSDTLAMRVSESSGRFRMSWGCGGGGENETGKVEVLDYDPATLAIRMEKADAKVCAPMESAFKRKKK